MKTTTHTEKHFHAARNLSAAAVIATTLVSPTTSFANPLDALKAKVQQATSKVTELKNNVQAKVEDVKEKIEDLDGQELVEAVRSMLEYVKQTQAGYQQFVGVNKCGAGSPCAAFRNNIRITVESFIKLPAEMPFMEHVPPAVRRLEQFAKLIDFLPPRLLFASEKVLGNAFNEIQYRLDMLRYAVSQTPRFPTMAELSDASARTSTVRTNSTTPSPKTSNVRTKTSMAADGTGSANNGSNSDQPSDPWCASQLENGKAKRELLTKSLEHLGDFLWDLGDLMEGDQVIVLAAASAGKGIESPAKPLLQSLGFVIKTIRQTAEIKSAAIAAICEGRGYQAQ